MQEHVYIEQPSGYVDPCFSKHVCKLKKALYGLKQALRAWFQHFNLFILKLGFTCSQADTAFLLFCIVSSTSFISYSMLMILFSLITITISSVALFDIFTQNSPPRIEVLSATFLVFKPPLPQQDSFSIRPSMLATFLHGLNSLISNRFPLLWLSLSIFPPLVPCLQISLYTVLLLVPCNT